jgi:hypothetical protein
MRRVPYPAPTEVTEPVGSLVVLVEPPVGPTRRAPVRRIPSGVALRLLVAGALFFGGVVWGASRAGGPELQSVSVAGGAPVALGPAQVGNGGALYPGGTADLSVPVANPNPFPVRITARVEGSDCRVQALSLVRPLVVPASLGLTNVVFPDAIQMGVLASNDCQGQVLSVTLSRLGVHR